MELLLWARQTLQERKKLLTVNMSCWVYCMHMQETKQQLKVVYILVLAADTVAVRSISDSVASYVLHNSS